MMSGPANQIGCSLERRIARQNRDRGDLLGF